MKLFCKILPVLGILWTSLFFSQAVFAADTSWYNESKSEFEIGTLDELEGFRDLVNSGTNFEGKTVYLTSDIDLESVESWEGIGTPDISDTEIKNTFKGNFDGNNHIIKNMRITSPSTPFVGFFSYIEGGSVSFLRFENANIELSSVNNYTEMGLVGTPTNYVGIACGLSMGGNFMCVQPLSGNVSVTAQSRQDGDITITDLSYCGGIAGIALSPNDRMNGGFNFCGNNADITSESGACAGIVASARAQEISYCYNKGAITGKMAGGLVENLSSGQLADSYNNAPVNGLLKALKSGICANSDEDSNFYSCVDIYPNDHIVFLSGNIYDCYVCSGGTVNNYSSQVDGSFTEIDLTSMTSVEAYKFLKKFNGYFRKLAGQYYPGYSVEALYGNKTICGDLLHDGYLRKPDIALCLKLLASGKASEEDINICDFDNNGNFEMTDIIYMIQGDLVNY
ncbi:MAG: hypothetical protein IJS61_00615 [Firmicutes bacterium]|nr:hypothetical protein [Bacillota bacterium]